VVTEQLKFKANSRPTIGVELELMLIDGGSGDLEPKAVQIVNEAGAVRLQERVKLEITESMIEINSSVHIRHGDLHAELAAIGRALSGLAERYGVRVCGGGAHPFHRWQERRVSPAERFQQVAHLYGYLAKQFTVFGQHIHIGCPDGDQAIRAIRRLSQYAPHFIALAAASPFYRGVDTAFDSCRSNVVAAFPLSGQMPDLHEWRQFVDFFERLRRLGLASSLKDLYWDIRPKPEFGTIELRVPDTPLDVLTAADLAAYAQVLVEWSRRNESTPWEDEYVYRHNRFQAARFGFEGQIVVSALGERCAIGDHVAYTIDRCSGLAEELECRPALERLAAQAAARRNGAVWLRERFEQRQSLPKMVRDSCERWRDGVEAATAQR
jgi:carboxylate-amine ligase